MCNVWFEILFKFEEQMQMFVDRRDAVEYWRICYFILYRTHTLVYVCIYVEFYASRIKTIFN